MAHSSIRAPLLLGPFYFYIMERQPTYYAIIPANVRYDKTIPMGAKMMYGEITALSNASGYCFASNGYFAELYGVTKQAISKWIKQLEAAGYVSVAYVDNNGVQQRRVSIVVEGYQPQLRGVSTPVDHNNTRKNNNSLSSENEFFSCSHKVTDALSKLTTLIATDQTVLGPRAAKAENLEKELEKWLRWNINEDYIFGNLAASLQGGKHNFESWLLRAEEHKQLKAAERDERKGYVEGTPYGDYRKKVEKDYPRIGNKQNVIFTEEQYVTVKEHIDKLPDHRVNEALKFVWKAHEILNGESYSKESKNKTVYELANAMFYNGGIDEYIGCFTPMVI